jgi:ATP-dependent exoDNAse (exonuclease V) beta subunit
MHFDIECFYNDIPQENTSKEYEYFNVFQQDFQREFPNYRPYRTEWTVFYKDLKLAGSVDMVFENKDDGTLMIYDWKRVKSIEYEAFGDRTATDPCLEDMPDSNFWHYSLQLNTYKAIIEAQYDKKVTKLVLVRLYPDAPTYELHECYDLQEKVKLLFENRRNELNK